MNCRFYAIVIYTGASACFDLNSVKTRFVKFIYTTSKYSFCVKTPANYQDGFFNQIAPSHGKWKNEHFLMGYAGGEHQAI
jgi:hypothetical protein